MLSSPNRLRDSNAIRRAMRGASAGHAAVVVHLVHRPADAALTQPRIAVVASKSVGNSVVRHTAARRLRHIAREFVASLPADVDVVIRARAAIVDTSYEELRGAVESCIRRAMKKADRP